MLNVKGSSAAEILRLSYKIVLKPALNAHAEKTKSVYIPKLDEPVDLQKKLHKDSTIREEKRNNLSSLKAKTDAVEDKKEPFLALSLSELQGVKSPLNKVQKMLKVYTRRKFKNGQQLDKVQKVLKVYTRRKFRKLLPAQSGSASVFPNGTSVAINQEMQEKLVITKDSSICRVRKGNGKTTTPLVDKGLRRSSRLNGQNDGYKQVQFSSPEKGKPRGRHAKKKAENTLP
uniref:Pco120628 n=1 Tax=Arundo donax TaxID=35708 RepID=A0A0A9D5W6_ARUDO